MVHIICGTPRTGSRGQAADQVQSRPIDGVVGEAWSVSEVDGAVSLGCSRPIRFPPRPEWMTAASDALRTELRRVRRPSGWLLEATLVGTLPEGSDLENVLLYNPPIPGTLLGSGVRIRKVASDRGGGCIQRYRYIPATAVSSHFGEGVRLTIDVPRPSDLSSARAIWLLIRRATRQLHDADRVVEGTISLEVTLGSPAGAEPPGRFDLVKRLIDGSCAAFHTYAGQQTDEVVRRLSRELTADPATIIDLLHSSAGALLGSHRFLLVRADGIQVSPADDRIEVAEVRFEHATKTAVEVALQWVQP